MIPRLPGFLNLQGAIGLVATAFLALWLGASRLELRHMQKQSARFEQLFRGEVAAHAATVAEVRAAAERARIADAANAARVRRDQGNISERTVSDFQARLADARARAVRLRQQPAPITGPGRGAGAPVPGFPTPSSGAYQASGEDRLSAGHLGADEALIATEQALQLEALIDWVRRQGQVRQDDSSR